MHNASFDFVTVSFRPKTAILFPGGNVIFTCNQTSFRFWIINETDNIVPNHDLLNINGVTSNGTMLIITQSVNNTLYGCAIALPGGDFITDTGIVYVASMYLCMYCMTNSIFFTV